MVRHGHLTVLNLPCARALSNSAFNVSKNYTAEASSSTFRVPFQRFIEEVTRIFTVVPAKTVKMFLLFLANNSGKACAKPTDDEKPPIDDENRQSY
jgi:hypothetical protein